jgi:hypothetical protein
MKWRIRGSNIITGGVCVGGYERTAGKILHLLRMDIGIVFSYYAYKQGILIQYIWAYSMGNQFDRVNITPLLELGKQFAVRSANQGLIRHTEAAARRRKPIRSNHGLLLPTFGGKSFGIRYYTSGVPCLNHTQRIH